MRSALIVLFLYLREQLWWNFQLHWVCTRKTHSKCSFNFTTANIAVEQSFYSPFFLALQHYLHNFPMPRKLQVDRTHRKICIFLASFHLTSSLYLSPNVEQKVRFFFVSSSPCNFFFFFAFWMRKFNTVYKINSAQATICKQQTICWPRVFKSTPPVERAGNVHCTRLSRRRWNY